MWSDTQKSFCVETYVLTNSLDETRRQYLKKFGLDHRRLDLAPGNKSIQKWVAKFRNFGTVVKTKPPGRGRTVRSEANIQRLSASTLQSPKRSTRRRSQALNISRTTLRRIMKEDLGLYPYRLSIHQKLSSCDRERRVAMAEWFEHNPRVFSKLWFSDEAHFWLNGYVNTHNAVHWGKEPPDEVLCRPLHCEKVTAWLAMRHGGGTIGPFFFENENEVATTINSARYVSTALEPFWRELGERPLRRNQEWFQQDGATPHTACASMDWVRSHFPDRHISLKSAVPWAPHSPDLSPLDFFMWGYLKDRVYAGRPATTHELKTAIVQEVDRIPADMVDKAIIHLKEVRLPLVKQRRGAHLEHIL